MERILKGVKDSVKLSRYTAFKIGGKARYFFVAKSKKELIEAIKAAEGEKLPFLILGEGSNILVSDKGYKGLVIKCRMSNVKLQKNKIYSEAGTKLKSLVKLSLKNSLAGIEWAAGIPGTIGGAVYGNAAAFWNSTANITEEIEVFDSKSLKIRRLSREDCQFSNKDSVFKHKKNLVILSVVLKLKKGRRKEIQRKIDEYLNYRKRNHPLGFPSAGCVFKNLTLLVFMTEHIDQSKSQNMRQMTGCRQHAVMMTDPHH